MKCGNFDMKCTFIYTGGKRLCKTCGAAKNLYTIHRGYQQAVDNPCAKEYPGAREARERNAAAGRGFRRLRAAGTGRTRGGRKKGGTPTVCP